MTQNLRKFVFVAVAAAAAGFGAQTFAPAALRASEIIPPEVEEGAGWGERFVRGERSVCICGGLSECSPCGNLSTE